MCRICGSIANSRLLQSLIITMNLSAYILCKLWFTPMFQHRNIFLYYTSSLVSMTKPEGVQWKSLISQKKSRYILVTLLNHITTVERY